MTPELEKQWRSGAEPFGGEVVTSSTDSSMGTLLKALAYFIRLAENTGEVLYIYEDWHEHDGYITQPKKIDLVSLRSMVADRESVIASIQGDDEVRTAVYPESFSWLMRWCVDLEDEAYSNFEFCTTNPDALDTLEHIYKINPEYLCRTNAEQYFRKRYSG